MKKIIFTFILALIVIIACEKVKQSAPKAFNTKVIAQPARAKTKKVETKVYKNIESSQLALIIKNFKATALNIQNHQAKLVENDSIPLDSAIWVIEAALNYEYDYDLEGAYEFSRTDTLVIPIPLNEDNLNVNSDDIEDAYLAFSSSLSDSSGSNYKSSTWT